MKSVLVSIQRPHTDNIKALIKKIEVRKNKPNQETPFPCFIYETKTKGGCGKVIGEFVCDKIYTYYADDFVGAVDFDGTIITEPKEGEFAYWIPNQEDTCLRYLDIKAYGKGKTLYGWHISDLKIYDKPKDLGNFITPCIWDNGREKHNSIENCKYFCGIKRPPQSWCYVEVCV